MKTEEAGKLVRKADRAIKVAETLIRKKYYSDCASKAYYAMFYAARALLLESGVDVVKHSAVEAAFGFHFAKTGRLNSIYHRMLIDARRVREIADYDIQEKVSSKQASLKLANAKLFFDAVRKVL